jgi:oxygen-independent coproporphyrinogen-3 oxidase
MAFYKNIFPSFDTIYIGGGTPSLLSVAQVHDILLAIHFNFQIHLQAEITMEVNPGDASPDYLQQLRALGINRINIGIQSFDDTLLKFLGRRHSARSALAAVEAARAAGFENLGMDFIYGASGQTMDSWKQTLKTAVDLCAEHLSCYQLSLDKKTPLHHRYHTEGLSLLTEDQALDYFLTTSRVLTDAGYTHYEVSNFARTDSLKSRHNMKYWCHTPYLGLGPAAHTFLDHQRWWNKSSVEAYLKSIAGGIKPQEGFEKLSLEQLRLEAWFLGMRTKDGIDLAQFKTSYGCDLLTDKKPIIDELIRNRLVELTERRLHPTLAGMAVADSLALI